MSDKRDVDPKAAAPSRRRPYRAPRLARLGTLTDITASIGSHGKNDHAGPQAPLRKTS